MKAGWKTVKLNDVCDIVKGRKPNLRATPNKGDLPYLVARYIRGLEDPEYGSPVEKGVVTLTEADTVIICDGSNSGEIFTGLNGIMSSTMGKVVKKTEIYDPYLRHFLSSTFELFNGTKTGSAIPHLDKDAFRKLEIPLPPLAEQKRIVALLDEAFAGIDEARARCDTNYRENSVLFQSLLKATFEQRGKTWKETRLSDICERVSVGHVGPTSEFYCNPSEGIPFLRSQNVRPGKLEWEGLQYITKDFHSRLRKSQLRKGDLLFVRVGANRGDCCAVLEDVSELNCANIVFARPTEGNAAYLERYCQSPVGRTQLIGMTTGAAQGVINTKSVAELIIPLPDKAEQVKVIAKLDELDEEIQKLSNLYIRKIAFLDELKVSLLTQAFAGELTA